MQHIQQIFDNLPPISEKRIAVRVKNSAERAIRKGHPWVYDQAIESQSFAGKAGDFAVVFDRKRRFLAIGLYDPDSPIRVKILHQGKPVKIDAAWFATEIRVAFYDRASILHTDTNAYRCVNGENDGLPGFILDCYDNSYVLKLYSAAWLPHLKMIVQALRDVVDPERIILRLSRRVQQGVTFGLRDGMTLFGEPPTGPIICKENGLLFSADIIAGQKTGHFLDQRDNRARVRDFSAEKQVLDVFACTGGFSLYAAHGGATHVTSLDMNRYALDFAEKNFRLNQHLPTVAACDHKILVGDAFKILANMQEQFDIVIIDPPSFAQKQDDIPKALEAYRSLTALGLRVLKPNGILVMSSCSSRVSAETFYATVHYAAEDEGIYLHDLERTTHALDHPISFREGAYLKCLIAQKKAGTKRTFSAPSYPEA